MKQNLDIINVEEKQTNKGKTYGRIKTNLGWMACFDMKAVNECKANIGKNCSVETLESGENGQYQNIVKFYQVENDEVITEKPGVPAQAQAVKTATRTMPKDPVGLAIEMHCKLLETNPNTEMYTAIKLVKEAQDAFS